jgi:hypothetical protein
MLTRESSRSAPLFGTNQIASVCAEASRNVPKLPDDGPMTADGMQKAVDRTRHSVSKYLQEGQNPVVISVAGAPYWIPP